MKFASVGVSIVRVKLESADEAAGPQVGAHWHVLAPVHTTDEWKALAISFR